MAHPTGHVQLTAVDTTWGEARGGALEASVDAQAGAGRFTLAAPDLNLNADGTFAFAEHPRLDAVLHARDVDLADVLTRAGQPALAKRVTGRLTGAASFAGDPLSPLGGQVTLDLDPVNLTLTPIANQPKELTVSLDRACTPNCRGDGSRCGIWPLMSAPRPSRVPARSTPTIQARNSRCVWMALPRT